MSISFENGQPLPTEGHHLTKLSSWGLRRCITRSSQYLRGEAILVPPVGKIAELMGVSRNALHVKGRTEYDSTIHTATGLEIVKHSGIILISGDTMLEPLADHPPVGPPGENEEIVEQITELAQQLPKASVERLGQRLLDGSASNQ